MRIHALQTGTVEIKRRQARAVHRGLRRRLDPLLDREWTARLPILAWAIEHDEGVIVVDTGETARASAPGYYPRWHPYYRWCLRVHVQPEDEIGPRLRAVGLSPSDVRLVVLTHLHTDHAGGLHHFPGCEIAVDAAEHRRALGLPGMLAGYLPHRWPSWFAPRPLAWDGAALGPFARTAALTRRGDVLAVPTPGHTPGGHVSVVVLGDGPARFLAGDATYGERALLDETLDGVAPDDATALASIRAVRTFVRELPTVYLPTHDPESAARLAGDVITRVGAGAAPAPAGEASVASAGAPLRPTARP